MWNGLRLGTVLWPSFWDASTDIDIPAGVEHLRIYSPDLSFDPLGPAVRLPRTVTSLALWTNFDESGLAFLSAIASSSSNALQKIHLRIPPTLPYIPLAPALRVIGPPLRRIRTFILDAAHTSVMGDLDIFSEFTSLGSFSWNGPLSGYPLKTAATETIQSIIEAFPPPATLRHLSVGTNDLSSLELIVSLLPHPTLSLLINLELPCLPAPTPPPAIADELADACKSRGIRLKIGSD